MIFFLSAVFLRRLKLAWSDRFQAFLIGERNLDFFTPDTFVPVDEISPVRIDEFLRTKDMGRWELLGWITTQETDLPPGYVSVWAGTEWAPEKWKAVYRNLGESGFEDVSVRLQISSEYRSSA